MMLRHATALRLTTALAAVALPAIVRAQKADTVVLANGDRITGEIKGVSKGKLTYDTDDAGQLSIEWTKVVRLVSRRTFEVVDRKGRRHIGPLREPVTNGFLAIGDSQPEMLRIVDAVMMTELGAGFLQRVNGATDIGFTYTKANRAATLSADGELVYRGRDVGSSIGYDIYRQKQADAPGVLRWTAKATASRYLKRDLWSLESVVAMQKNDELNLVRRLLGGGGLGRTLHRSNSDDVRMVLGMAVAEERFRVDTSTVVKSTDVEAVLRASADVFRFDKPKLSATTDLWTFQSFSTARRVRGDVTFDVKYTGMQDFSVGVQVKDVFDAKPPTTNARRNDFQVTFTFGWSYRR